jgi:hypothetical protein
MNPTYKIIFLGLDNAGVINYPKMEKLYLFFLEENLIFLKKIGNI